MPDRLALTRLQVKLKAIRLSLSQFDSDDSRRFLAITEVLIAKIEEAKAKPGPLVEGDLLRYVEQLIDGWSEWMRSKA